MYSTFCGRSLKFLVFFGCAAFYWFLKDTCLKRRSNMLQCQHIEFSSTMYDQARLEFAGAIHHTEWFPSSQPQFFVVFLSVFIQQHSLCHLAHLTLLHPSFLPVFGVLPVYHFFICNLVLSCFEIRVVTSCCFKRGAWLAQTASRYPGRMQIWQFSRHVSLP